jgi:hypothetical protein
VKQQPLFKREKPTLPQKAKAAQAGQLEAARIILADPKADGAWREWAERIVKKTELEKMGL